MSNCLSKENIDILINTLKEDRMLTGITYNSCNFSSSPFMIDDINKLYILGSLAELLEKNILSLSIDETKNNNELEHFLTLLNELKNKKQAQNDKVAINICIDNTLYDSIKAHAESKGESVNGFVNRAIDETMQRETESGT